MAPRYGLASFSLDIGVPDQFAPGFKLDLDARSELIGSAS
jgi:hypothetical protein